MMLVQLSCCLALATLSHAASDWMRVDAEGLLVDPPDEILLQRSEAPAAAAVEDVQERPQAASAVSSCQRRPAAMQGPSLMQISVKSSSSLKPTTLSPAEAADVFRKLDDEFDEPKTMLISEQDDSLDLRMSCPTAEWFLTILVDLLAVWVVFAVVRRLRVRVRQLRKPQLAAASKLQDDCCPCPAKG
eukprot:TRINITY_DN75737_c0_g1_i1.p1 TRINITY_DN75737_c0_g1~~TRINITY_DN75737_c0_g1_i1.p1  ORF type:complete len:188 (-),score=38.98 TRINITY_DN75737_c0_g1_i1:145-708(-)